MDWTGYPWRCRSWQQRDPVEPADPMLVCTAFQVWCKAEDRAQSIHHFGATRADDARVMRPESTDTMQAGRGSYSHVVRICTVCSKVPVLELPNVQPALGMVRVDCAKERGRRAIWKVEREISQIGKHLDQASQGRSVSSLLQFLLLLPQAGDRVRRRARPPYRPPRLWNCCHSLPHLATSLRPSDAAHSPQAAIATGEHQGID